MRRYLGLIVFTLTATLGYAAFAVTMRALMVYAASVHLIGAVFILAGAAVLAWSLHDAHN